MKSSKELKNMTRGDYKKHVYSYTMANGSENHMDWYVGKTETLITVFLIVSAQMSRVAAIGDMELSASIFLKLLKHTIHLWVVLISPTCDDYTATVQSWVETYGGLKYFLN
jgi:hypothetical protein